MSQISIVRTIVEELEEYPRCEHCESMQRHTEKVGTMIDQERRKVRELREALDQSNQVCQALWFALHLARQQQSSMAA